jgi:chromosome segregation protein
VVQTQALTHALKNRQNFMRHKLQSFGRATLLADCETALKTEYNEVTVTRRVFASGDGQYLINKVPCRLKDIQRLFMDTGIGRTSYSVMEQGKIDQILSSRPEDRRAVFEEASGITKFKADRKECLRKLDQTEANLLRLEDVIREVKRQIISLQRQAGKAKRYKEQMEVLRGYDLFTTRFRLEEIDTKISGLDSQVNQLTVDVESQRHRVEQRENAAGEIRLALNATDEDISKAMDEAVAARNAVDGARQAVQANKDRISELEAYSSRDSRDAQEAADRLEQHRASLEANTSQLADAEVRKSEAEARWASHRAAFEAIDAQTRELRAAISRMRDKTFQLETHAGKTQNALTEYETREQATLVKKERLLSEKAQLEGAAEGRKARLEEATAQHAALQTEVDTARRQISEMQTLRGSKNSDVSEQRRKLGALDQKTAAARERIRLLSSPRKGDSGFPEGARLLLTPADDGLDRAPVLGALADVLQIDPAWQKAFESVLRSWLDAVVVRDPAGARRALQWISQQRSGAVRVLSATCPGSAPPVAENALFHHIRCPDDARDLARHLFGRVVGVIQAAEIPEYVAPDMVYVTAEGLIVRGDGSGEAWDPEDQADNPVARRAMRDQAEKELAGLEAERAILGAHIEELAGEGRALEERINAAQQEVQRVQAQVSQREGELRMIRREAAEAEQRLRTVSNELQQLALQEERGGNQREELRSRLQTAREELTAARAEYTSLTQQSEKAEAERVALGDRATEQRIAFSELAQQATQLQRQCDAARDRIRELEQLIEQREKGISDYRQRLESLNQLIAENRRKFPRWRRPFSRARKTCRRRETGVRSL